MGIALPAAFASPGSQGNRAPAPAPAPAPAQRDNSAGGSGAGQIPQHLQVLQRLSAASTSPSGSQQGQQRPRVRTTVDDLAEKISATNFVLAGESDSWF
jgi:hypothetical protein